MDRGEVFSRAGDALTTAVRWPHAPQYAACGDLTAALRLEPVQENTSPRSAGAADRAPPRSCWPSSQPVLTERSARLPRQAEALMSDSSDTFGTFELILVDFDGNSRCIRRGGGSCGAVHSRRRHPHLPARLTQCDLARVAGSPIASIAAIESNL